MTTKMMNKCFDVSQHSSSCSQTLASIVSTSYAIRRRGLTNIALAYRSAIFGTKFNSLESLRKHGPIKRAVSASSLDAEFSDEELSKKIQQLALQFQVSDDVENKNHHNSLESSNWPGDMIPANIERKANSVDLPFSLRIIKKKKQWQEGLITASESAYCSVKKAFSSMVFIIRELQSYTLQMREMLFYEDLQDILVRVQQEMNASFVWLFQQVFSQTPTLMVYVMILLANYSVHSMSNNFAIAAAIPPPTTMESVSERFTDNAHTKFESSTNKTFSAGSSGNGRSTSIGGNNGGGGKSRAVASGTEGDGKFDETLVSSLNPTRISEESVSGRVGQMGQEEELWDLVVNEAEKMQGSLDHETMKQFVSPVKVEIEEEDIEDYFKTELLYQTGLSQEPNNPMLLANYAQFLYLVARDYDRAEEYFKRASMIEPKDAEALNKYASFLWQIRKDLWAAEESYLEAISADPNNSFYAANYAHFLWNTGGEDTCFPLDSSENSFSSEL